ncbi:MAG: LLM class flavin-dependent oxidoreductase [Candidatus Nanopelagicales bacterium]
MTADAHRLPDPTLVVLVGPSASGKSVWASEHFAPDQVVSSDRLRALVGESEHDLAASADAFDLLDRIVAARMGRRLTTVVDTLGLEPDRRRHWMSLAHRRRVPTVAVVFDTPAAECRRRNAARDHRVPAGVLAHQQRNFAEQRALLEDEGYDEVLPIQAVRMVPAAVAAAARAAEAVAAKADLGGRRLRFGLHLSSWDAPGGAPELRDRVRDVAGRAEAAGFDSIWVMDHMRQIPQNGRAWDDMLESTTTLGYLAGATSRTTLGALVNCVTYRNIAHLGKIVSTLDVLSSGRAWCGLGLGWYADEHHAYGWRFPSVAERYTMLEDALRVLPLMWGKGSPSFSGSVTSVPEAMAYPRPLAGRVPMLVGGSGERRTLRLAAQYADACNLFGDVETVRHKVEVLRRHCADLERDPADVEVTHLGTVLVAGDATELSSEVERRQPPRQHAQWSRRVTAGTVDDHVLRARGLQAVGVEHVIVSLVGIWDSPAIERFGDVIDACRR